MLGREYSTLMLVRPTTCSTLPNGEGFGRSWALALSVASINAGMMKFFMFMFGFLFGTGRKFRSGR